MNSQKNILSNKWSKQYNECKKCGTQDNHHVAKGLCVKCYNIEINNKHSDYKRNKRGVADAFLTKEKLIELYIEKELSMSEIGKLAGTSRTNVYLKMKKLDVPIRTKKESRDLALDKSKLKYKTVNSNDNEIITLKRKKYNTNFFGKWSNEMAYTLGLIFTDGNVFYSKAPNNVNYVQGTFAFGQKDKELITKISNLIGYEGKIQFRKERHDKKISRSEIYMIIINSSDLLLQLERFNITPNKSMDMKFPEIPTQYLKHFIRGCWDGDGSVYMENNRIRASYVSGSLSFIENLMEILEDFGLSKRKLYQHKHSDSYYFRYVSDDDCQKLYNLMYKNVSPELYYSKKYNVFKEYFGNLKA